MSVKRFVMKRIFENFAAMRDGESKYGEVEEHFNVPWSVEIKRQKDKATVYFHCKNPKEAAKWSIKGFFDVDLTTDFRNRCYTHFCFTSDTELNTIQFELNWNEFMQKIVKNNRLEIRPFVYIHEMSGIPRKKLKSFDAKELSDVVLIVENEKFYVSKLFLATQSAYFKTLFDGSFAESNQSEITLKDINPIDFQCFLEVLYGESAIDDDTVTGILRLAEMYETDIVIQKCEEFLIEKSFKSEQEKLKIAADFNIKPLMDHCLSKIKNYKDIRALLPANDKSMNPELARIILYKLVQMFDQSILRHLFPLMLNLDDSYSGGIIVCVIIAMVFMICQPVLFFSVCFF